METEQFAMTYRGYRVSLGVTWAVVGREKGYRGNFSVHGLTSAQGTVPPVPCQALAGDFDLALTTATHEAQTLIDRTIGPVPVQ